MDKDSSYLRKFGNLGHKKFFNSVTWSQCYLNFFFATDAAAKANAECFVCLSYHFSLMCEEWKITMERFCCSAS